MLTEKKEVLITPVAHTLQADPSASSQAEIGAGWDHQAVLCPEGCTHPVYPFLHGSFHHGSFQLLLCSQVPRNGPMDLRSSFFFNAPQPSLEGTGRQG